ncbi:MAG: PAS domain S-box protein [Bacteroidota bacterium]
MSDVIYTINTETVVTYISPVIEKICGYAPSEIIGKSVIEFVHSDDVINVLEAFQKFYKTGIISPIEFRALTKDGQQKWLHSTGTFYFDGEKLTGIRGIFSDITEKKIAEIALQEKDERYRAIVQQTSEGIVAYEVETKNIIEVNDMYVHWSGYSREELLQKNIYDIVFNEREKIDATIETILHKGKLFVGNRQHKKKNGGIMDVEVNATMVFYAGKKIIATNIRDISERKKLEEQVIHLQKMEGIGTLAGGIAHDFNNILSIIIGYTSLTELTHKNSEKVLHNIEIIRKAAERGASLVRQLLTFARKSNATHSMMDLNSTIEELKNMLEQTLPKTIILLTQLDEHLPRIKADGNQIHQALLNLCVNACDAMPLSTGNISITTKSIASSSLHSHLHNNQKSDFICVEISDSGIGMNDETRCRIFEPFFTTKEKGKGTGLGLAVVFGIVNSHNGFIDVESKIGIGTTFRLYFPIVDENEEEIVVEQKVISFVRGGNETILIVEDETLLSDLISSTLQTQGYKTIIAKNGEEAIEKFEKNQHIIQLVVSDIGLPRMNGWEAFQKMLEIKKNIKVIFASGYLEPTLYEKIMNAGYTNFVQKPYDRNELLIKIRAILDAEKFIE